MSVKFKNVHKETTRHGQVAYYYRAPNSRRIRLPDDHGSESFAEAVRLAAVMGIGRAPKAPDNVTIRNRSRIGKALAIAIKGAKQRAKSKGLPFDLDMDWAIKVVEQQNLRCGLTGIPFYWETDARSSRHPFAPSLDRIMAIDGYTKANVRIVSFAVNVMLLDWGVGVLERIAMGYRANKIKTSIPAPCRPAPAPRKKSRLDK